MKKILIALLAVAVVAAAVVVVLQVVNPFETDSDSTTQMKEMKKALHSKADFPEKFPEKYQLLFLRWPQLMNHFRKKILKAEKLGIKIINEEEYASIKASIFTK